MHRTMRLWNLLWLLLLPPALAAVPAGAQTALRKPTPTAAVQVTRNPNPARAHAAAQIARNPKTGELVIAETEVRNLKTCNVHVSVDDGRSWFPGGDPMVRPFTDCSGDPDANVNFWLEFDRSGVLYLTFPANDPKDQPLPKAERRRHIFLARSRDSGRTFETTMVWQAPEIGTSTGTAGNRNGRTWLAIDPNDPRYVYVTWMNWRPVETGGVKNRPMIAASSDGGKTFAEPVDLGEPEKSWYEPRPAVDGDGVVHVLFPSRESAATGQEPIIRSGFHRRSTDHGKTWSPATVVDEGNAGFSFARKWGLEADPHTNTLYALWYGNANPRATRPADDRDVFLRVSSDSGKTWSAPKPVNDDAQLPNVQHYDPGLAIAPNGRVDIAWFDFRNSPEPEIEDQGNFGGLQDVYYTSSSDQGKILSSNVRITDRMIDRRVGVWSNHVHIHAPVGIASTDESVYFAWQDTRNGTPEMQSEDVYFASLKLNGPVLAVAGGGGVPPWAVGGAGVALGMGAAMILVLVLSRRGRGAVAPSG